MSGIRPLPPHPNLEFERKQAKAQSLQADRQKRIAERQERRKQRMQERRGSRPQAQPQQ